VGKPRKYATKRAGFFGPGGAKKKEFSAGKWGKADSRAGNGAGKDILEKKEGLDCYI